MKKRVVVTGIGTVNPLGNNVETTWEKLIKGESGIGRLTRRNPDDFSVKVAAEINDFDASQWIDKKEARRMDLFVQYALASSKMAVQDAGLKIGENAVAEKVGVWFGSGIGGMETYENQVRVFDKKGAKRVSPFFIPTMIANMAAGQISIHLGAKGINTCTTTACASATHAIGDAFKVIQRGDAEVMIAGGTEAPISDLSLAGFSSMKALSFEEDPSKACRPFDAKRNGFVMGEGSGTLVLEEYEHAVNRGANIYAEVVGYGATADAFHITSPSEDGEGAARSMKMAIDDGGLVPSDIDYINAHGTSTPLNDKFETYAIKSLFGEDAKNVAISSTKSMTGHLLGAAGAIEGVISVLTLKNGIIPPTINYETPDPECDLDYVPNVARKKDCRFALSNSLGFGGHNATLVFKAFNS